MVIILKLGTFSLWECPPYIDIGVPFPKGVPMSEITECAYLYNRKGTIREVERCFHKFRELKDLSSDPWHPYKNLGEALEFP